jgi:hypothetical protein
MWRQLNDLFKQRHLVASLAVHRPPFQHAVTSVLLQTALKGACLLIPMSCDCMHAIHPASPNLPFDISGEFSTLRFPGTCILQ